MASILSVEQLQGLAAGSTPNTITIPTGQTLYAPGHVIQVQSTFKNDTFSTSSTTYVDVTGLTVSITPHSTSSKILVIAKINVGWDSTLTKCYACLARGGTAIDLGVSTGRVQAGFEYYVGDPHHAGIGNLQILDSPASTSALTYSCQIKNQGNGNVYCNRSHNFRASAPAFDGVSSSTITVMEIAQ